MMPKNLKKPKLLDEIGQQSGFPKTRLQKINLSIHRWKLRKYRMENRSLSSPQNQRKARTRTLIQLGGLIEKSGLLESINIDVGSDLQKDIHLQENVAILMGGLVEIKEQLKEEMISPTLLKIKGKRALF